ncbi:cytochrome b-c1 complex subunit 7 [Xylocopa sonorina]|uniref:cytochrome b-c1 complex subunit 7 n=1 Tax=Xylocopa sonorina TaxID=1818115 RepID=UPI00403B05A3
MSRISTILKAPARLIKRYGTQSQGNRKDWKFAVKKFAFNCSEYNRYGLYTDDIRDYDNNVIQEALRRLPKDVLDARNFRLVRAAQLDFLKTYLPEEKWISYEQDLEYRYLQPYIDEIVAERMEINEFGCSNYSEDDWPQGELK